MNLQKVLWNIYQVYSEFECTALDEAVHYTVASVSVTTHKKQVVTWRACVQFELNVVSECNQTADAAALFV